MAEATAGQEIPPNMTLYIKNLNEKIKVDRLKKSLHAVFAQFGKILDIMAFKTLKHKGQAWVVFEDFDSATKALRQMQGFPFYDEPMKIQYAKTKSDVISKADGTYVPREKRKKRGEKGGKKREEQHDPNLTGVAMSNPAYVSGHRASPSVRASPILSHLQYPGERPIVPEAPAAPNNILFIQNLPHGTISSLLQSQFNQYPGLKEVRMVETKPGISFVEYEDEVQATAAMSGLQGLKIEANNMVITYANR